MKPNKKWLQVVHHGCSVPVFFTSFSQTSAWFNGGRRLERCGFLFKVSQELRARLRGLRKTQLLGASCWRAFKRSCFCEINRTSCLHTIECAVLSTLLNSASSTHLPSVRCRPEKHEETELGERKRGPGRPVPVQLTKALRSPRH